MFVTLHPSQNGFANGKHDPFWWYNTKKNKGDDEIWNWNEHVEFEGFCLLGVISRNPSEKRSVKSFPARKKRKTLTNQALAPTKLVFCLVFVGVSEQKTTHLGISNCSLKLRFRYGNTKKVQQYIVQKILKRRFVYLGKHVHLFSQLKFASDFTLFQSQDFRVSDEVWVSMENLRWISFGCSAFPYFCGQMQWNIATNKWHQNQQLDHLYSWGTNVTSYMTSPSNHQM